MRHDSVGIILIEKIRKTFRMTFLKNPWNLWENFFLKKFRENVNLKDKKHRECADIWKLSVPNLNPGGKKGEWVFWSIFIAFVYYLEM